MTRRRRPKGDPIEHEIELALVQIGAAGRKLEAERREDLPAPR